MQKRKCEICDDLQQIMKCKHYDCRNDKKIYCADCGIWIHRKKSHNLTLIQCNDNNKNPNAFQLNIQSKAIVSLQSEESKISDFRKLSINTMVDCESAISSVTWESVNFSNIKCEGLCQQIYSSENVFICKHMNCLNDKIILCHSCGQLQHDNYKKSHSFDADKNYVICVQDLIQPDQTHFKSGLLNGMLKMRGIHSVEKFLWKSRWLGALGANLSHIGIDLSTGAIVGTALGVSAVTAGAGVILATGIEWAFLWRQYRKNRISGREAAILGGTALISSSVSVASFFGFMATGAAIGSAIGPVGTVIGSFIGAIVCGIVTRKALNELADKYFKKKHETRTALQKEALAFFFGDANYAIDDITTFNEKKLRREYHRLSLIYHPDRKDGDYVEWLKLCSYYGILTAICEEHIESKIGGKDSAFTLAQASQMFNAMIKKHPNLSHSILENVQKANKNRVEYATVNAKTVTTSSGSDSETKSATFNTAYSHLESVSQEKFMQ